MTVLITSGGGGGGGTSSADATPITIFNGVTYKVVSNTQPFARLMFIQPSGEVTIAHDAELVFA